MAAFVTNLHVHVIHNIADELVSGVQAAPVGLSLEAIFSDRQNWLRVGVCRVL